MFYRNIIIELESLLVHKTWHNDDDDDDRHVDKFSSITRIEYVTLTIVSIL